MKRAVIALCSLAAFLAAGYSFYYFGIKPSYDEIPSLWLVFVPFAVLFAVGFGLLIWSFSSNIYNIKAGTVIDHRFRAAYMSSGIHVPIHGSPGVHIPAHWVPDTWAIQVQDARGRTAWLEFNQNVFTTYPRGSYYGGE